jgi:acyl-ACP thioesterase
MESIYTQEFKIADIHVNRFGKLKLSTLLYFAQEVAGRHFDRIAMTYDHLAAKGMFWAIIRQRVAITRLPMSGETIRVETWPMPNTRVAFPRHVAAYDEKGNELFRVISLWVLMDLESRSMILPGKSGILLPGTTSGNELPPPASLPAKQLLNHRNRTVCFTDLDRNGHMNNTKYLDWIADLLPSSFHEQHSPQEFTVCYLSEAREGQELTLSWDFTEEGCLNLDAHRLSGEKSERIFSARLQY